MRKLFLLVGFLITVFAFSASAQGKYETDIIKTSAGDLEITFIGHGTLMLTVGGKVIHVDPFGMLADYSKLPGADVVLITHDHFDHFDMKALKILRNEKTVVVLPGTCAARLKRGVIMNNGDVKTIQGMKIEAVPAYNIVHMRSPGRPFHEKGIGNGYVITIGEKRLYVAGDTENTPEMKGLKNVDIAFLPMNLPYTMTPDMVADAAKAFKPKILYPYHYGETDTSKIEKLLDDEKEIQVRIRKMR